MSASATPPLIYRLALDLGSTSLGWAIFRLSPTSEPDLPDYKLKPTAIIKAGVRIFSDGRNPKDGSSLAVTRRAARAMRRRRDRLLKRKARMLQKLMDYGFFPTDAAERKTLERLNPYELRAKGLNEALTPAEFGRALFHINQRRGFKSNRKTDSKESDAGALKTAISALRQELQAQAQASGETMTVGKLLWQRMSNPALPAHERTVRARYRENRVPKDDGKTKIEKSYDLYIDRQMIADEFDALWQKQAELNPAQFTETARADLRDTLLHQRPLRPVRPGRCTLLPDEERAPLALPSTQRFRIYQEVNNLRLLDHELKQIPLTREQRDKVVDALEHNGKVSFKKIRSLLKLKEGVDQFNLEDEKRQELKGNSTSAVLSKEDRFGADWYTFSPEQQDNIVLQLLLEESEAALVEWLQAQTGVDKARAEKIANAALPEGYGSLSRKALAQILPALQSEVITYDKAVQAAGFAHHSNLDFDVKDSEIKGWAQVNEETGEVRKPILKALPYYGKALQRHVAFGSGNPDDSDEKRYGKIANPTVHIGLNQVRVVVNALIKKYGHPAEVVVEVARDLKQSREQKQEEQKRQAANQKRNARIRASIAETLGISEERVSRKDIQKWILWEELSFDVAYRCCPYSGTPISAATLLSPEVEIEHILPFSQTLDDSLNNRTVSLVRANRVKGNRTPWDARADFAAQGWDYDSVLLRADRMPKAKRKRFAPDGYQQWLGEDKGFLARALNDTRYLSRVAKAYLQTICPTGVRVIPGQMTAMLRGKFGLNDVLGLDGEKNRNDHRHHAVDACVIGITDQGMLQAFADASKVSREKERFDKLVENMPEPFKNYRVHVKRAVAGEHKLDKHGNPIHNQGIWVSHKPDHGHEGAMHNDTAYGLRAEGRVSVHKMIDGVRTRVEENLKVIAFDNKKAEHTSNKPWFGSTHHKQQPYKGYKGDSNYCIEIVRNEKGKWEGEVISTYEAYQLENKLRAAYKAQHGSNAKVPPFLTLLSKTQSISGKPLVMRLMRDDYVRMSDESMTKNFRIAKIAGNGQIFLCALNEANVDARNRNKDDPFSYVSKMAGSLKSGRARCVTISPIGEVRDPGFRE